MKKVLLVFWGESFRWQQGRDRGIHDSDIRQFVASRSHKNLIDFIINKFNYDVDIFINTYKLNQQYDEQLLNYYKNIANVVTYNFHDNLFENETGLLNNTWNNILPYYQ